MDLTAYFKPSPSLSSSPSPATSSKHAKPITHNDHNHPITSPPSRDQHPPAPPSAPPRALPPELTVEPLTQPHLHPFRRITSLLLPIRYPDKFYADIIADPTVSALTRIAIWRDLHRPGKRKRNDDGGQDSAESAEKPEQGKVVGGIRCRLEEEPASSEGGRAEKRVYVQTLCLLSPYRTMGVGTALLDAVVQVGIRGYGITSVYAHVWEANTEALEWYRKRGFEVEELELGYYRRLKPAGARVVRRLLGVRDYLAAGVCHVPSNGSLGVGDVEDVSTQNVDAGG